MILNKKITVVLPAYNAAKTLMKTYSEIPFEIVDDVILVDDDSIDNTVEIARKLEINCIVKHDRNKGYGANQKTCYTTAIARGADIVVMLHPDYQYTPKLITSIASIIAYEIYPVVIGSRILGNGALRGGMPVYKYVANRALTLFQNILLRQKLSEYHSGYRAYSVSVLNSINYVHNSDDFIFDNELLAQVLYRGFPVCEITCPTSYFPEASSINLVRSIKYGFGVVGVSLLYRLSKLRIVRHPMFRAA